MAMDEWFRPASEPTRPPIKLADEVFTAFVDFSVPVIEDVKLDKWFQPASEPVRPAKLVAEGFTVIALLEYNRITGDITLPSLTIQATGYGGARGNAALPSLQVEASGTTGAVITGDVSLPQLAINALGAMRGDISLPQFVINATLTAGNVGIANGVLPGLLVSASGTLHEILSGNVTLPRLSINATGLAGNVGNADIALGIISVEARGVPGHFHPGADIQLPSLVVSASGFSDGNMTAGITLPQLKVYAHLFNC